MADAPRFMATTGPAPGFTSATRPAATASLVADGPDAAADVILQGTDPHERAHGGWLPAGEAGSRPGRAGERR